jgi:hypothetical protein
MGLLLGRMMMMIMRMIIMTKIMIMMIPYTDTSQNKGVFRQVLCVSHFLVKSNFTISAYLHICSPVYTISQIN